MDVCNNFKKLLDMIFNWNKKKRLEIEMKERQNLESYISYFPADKMKYQYAPFILELAGARYNKDDNLGFLFKTGDQVLLFQEPNNPFDKDAVKVVNLKGQNIGHIPKNFAKNIGEDLENGFYYKVTIDTIVDDLLYPYISLKLIKHSDLQEQKVTETELQEFWDNKEKKKKESDTNFNTAYELSQKGLEYENDGDMENAVIFFEKSIEINEVPTISFKRLVIYYRKIKDYDNEIRVIKKWLKHYDESSANMEVIDFKTAEIKKRLEFVLKLKGKS
jgi:tetratricopeptide (TPR) repeat protein